MSLSITAAAIRTEDGKVYTSPRPNRHADILLHFHSKGVVRIYSGEQGFVTSENKFVSRKEALEIAKNAGQIVDWDFGGGRQLYTENLW